MTLLGAIFARSFGAIAAGLRRRWAKYCKCGTCGGRGVLVMPCRLACLRCGERWKWEETGVNRWKKIVTRRGIYGASEDNG